MAILSGLFVFFIAMLETNALRAGISQSIAVVGLLVAARSGRLWPLLVAATIAATFHLSSLAVTLVLCGSWIFFRQFGVSVRSFRILALVTLLLGVSFSVPWIANYFSRVDVYARLEESSGSPWLKMLPLLSVILSGFAVWCSERLIRERRRQVRHTHMQRFTMPATVPVAASCAVIVFLFGTTLYVFNSMPVLSARVWQMTVPFGFLPCALAIRWRVLNPRERQIVWAVLALVACAFIYQFMFRHVLTNFFSPLIGHQDLDLGQCASGLCE
ncbi:MAG: putative EpsG family protein [Prokaryotic dsDNA virus sp.]|nr:MAG: putative EpsG family protein [Prokaryotic dsDNA virus sp.]|tara:strand:- start:4489 stop:5304 length:816 start_codon:yes stop_codon:yes gene_type:complete